MGSDTPFSGNQDVLVDANIFYAIGDPSNSQYRRFRSVIRNAGVVCKLPRRVIGELGGPETDRVRTALDEGWATIIDAPSPTDGDAVAASDIAKRTIANETDQPEHEVEKTDAILAGLAIQHVRDRSTAGVIVLTDDKPAKKGIENAVRAQGYTDTIAVHRLEDIIGDDSGDSMRLI
ncbi:MULTISPECIES: hypothetical protein [Halorubrum]|uniref:NYN domain-containing protein n=1 Tax=Halorubrum halodurans TaxID=1383851 RepID=A0A256IFT2_9EURY|nr:MULTISPECIES: hypothetical protein [Halorubrum]MDB9300316.1 hypothetical protein [Halorubrum ezzemoulense]OYR55421.1 hypothetical protein DJ70_11615 [Halorubrum halodurans]